MSAIANNVVSLEEILNKFPTHPLARVVTEWLASLNKTLQDVVWWEILIKPSGFYYRAYVSVQFTGNDETRYNETFRYSQFEFEKGNNDHGSKESTSWL